MQTNSWLLYPTTRIPKWEPNLNKICWDTEGESILLELPIAISTAGEAQCFLDESFIDTGSNFIYCGWDVKRLFSC